MSAILTPRAPPARPVAPVHRQEQAGLPNRVRPPSSVHRPGLDGVRGLAIALVMSLHVWRAPATALGWSGVDLFFVLSGFLITGILWDTRADPGRARVFYLRRALRILPLYYAVLVAVFIVRPALGMAHRRDDLVLAGEQVWYWTYLCDWRIAFGHPPGQTFLTHFWTLSIEEQFYLVWPLLVWRSSRRVVLGIAGAVAAGALVLRCFIVAHAMHPDLAYALLPCRIDALAVGAALAVAVRGPHGPEAVRRWVGGAAAVGAGTLALLIVTRPDVRFVDPAMMTIGYTAIDWVSAGLVFAGATGGLRALEWQPLRLAGRYSYGLYVYHPLVIWWLIRDAAWLERRAWAAAIAAVLGSVALACASYHLYESPILRWRDRWARPAAAG